MADFGNVQNFGFSFFLTIPINPQKRSIPPVCINKRQGKNQMADFGNVQNQPFAFFPLPSYTSTGKFGGHNHSPS